MPHHGSASSSTRALLDAARPDVAIVSAGRGNPFGHPASDVLTRYERTGAAVFRTDRDGAVTLWTDGTAVEISSWTGRRMRRTLRRHDGDADPEPDDRR